MVEERCFMDDQLYNAARLPGTDNPNFHSDELHRIQTACDESNVLHVASRYSNHAAISVVLNHLPADSRYRLLCKHNSKGETPLHLAAQFGDLQTVQKLLDYHYVDVPTLTKPCWGETDNLGDTPLHKALKYGNDDIALLLLERGAQTLPLISLCNKAGESLAYLAANNGCPLFLQTILDDDRYRQCFVSLSGSCGQTAFHAARKLNEDIMEQLIRRGDVHHLKDQDNKGKTVLHYAVEEKRERIVHKLLKTDSSLAWIHDQEGLTPLHKAAAMGLFSMIQIILDLSPQSIAIRDKHGGRTALHVAKMEASFLAGCLKKTRMKELINEVDSEGNTVLHTALIKSDMDSPDTLLEVSGINWRLENKDGLCPMDLCKSEAELPLKLKCLASRWRMDNVLGHMENFSNGSVRDVDDLLDRHGWDVCKNFRGPNGDSILHIAARDGCMKIIRAMRSNDDIHLLMSKTNFKGETPLHLAAEYGKLKAVNAILSVCPRDDGMAIEMGGLADLRPWRMKSGNGDTPAHRAIRNRHEKIVVLLLRLDAELASFINNSSKSLLYLAAQCRCYYVSKEILSGARNDSVTHPYSTSGPEGKNPLHAAVAGKSSGEAIALLLMGKRRDLVREVDNYGKTPLHYAATNARTSVVKELVKLDKSTAFMYDNEGFTPLLRAAAVGYHMSMAVILHYCPMSAELRDVTKNRTALHLIANMTSFGYIKCINHTNMAKLINETDTDGNTPLHSAILNADKNKVLALLKSSYIHWRIRNKQYRMPLDLCKELMKTDEDQGLIHTAIRDLERGQLGCWDWTIHRFLRMTSQNANVRSMRKKELKQLLNSVALVATLLVTVTFAALFTVPGGYNPSGKLVRIKYPAIHAFIAFDVVAMLLGIGVLQGYTTAISTGYQTYLEDIATKCVSNLQYSLRATIIAFLIGLYVIVSSFKPALWVLCLAGGFAIRVALIPWI